MSKKRDVDSLPLPSADLIEYAREIYAADSNDDIEVDDDARVSRADAGVWVQAWVYVPDSHWAR